MQKILLIFVFLTCWASSIAQDLVPYRKGNLWGYSSPQGKIVIEPVYERTHFFTGDGVARVKSKGLYGFINKTGAFTIKPQFTDAGDFEMGVARVQSKSGSWCINLEGEKEECNPDDEVQDLASEPLELFALVQAGPKVKLIINNTGDTIPQEFDKVEFISRYFFPQTNYFAVVYANGMIGAYNQQGILVAPVKYKQFDILDMESFKAAENNKWGVIKFDGTEVLPFAYDSVKKVTELLFLEERLNKNDHYIVMKNAKYGVVDHSNSIILKTEYDKIVVPQCSCPTEYVVTKNGLTGIANHKGVFVVTPKYKSIEPFKGAEVTSVTTATGKEGYIRKNGMEYFTE